MYEKLLQKPISRSRFFRRIILHLGIIFLIIMVSLAIGICGFMFFENIPFHKAFLNTAILLSGLGLIDRPMTPSGHWFIGIFGLYSGLVFLASLGVLMAPIIHRIVHKLHWDGDAPSAR